MEVEEDVIIAAILFRIASALRNPQKFSADEREQLAKWSVDLAGQGLDYAMSSSQDAPVKQVWS